MFRSLYARRFKADIFGFEKTRVELRLTVVDRSGHVVFDSRNRTSVTTTPKSATSRARCAASTARERHPTWKASPAPR